jgi:GH24 family phage-related lysozyme (muramidase)
MSIVCTVTVIPIAFSSRSSLVRDLNANNYQAAANDILKYNKVYVAATKSYVVSKGLVSRRAAERAMFLGN